jgi:Spy/CpxP family protein refolding chaperone
VTRTRAVAGLLVGGLLAAAAAASPSLAQAPGPPGPAPGHESPMGWVGGRGDGELWLMIRAARLNPEQQARVRAILSAHRATTRPLIEQLRQAQQELGDRLLGPGQVQAADLQPQLQRIGQLRDQLAQDSATAALEVRAVLTPEQLARVAQTKDRLKQLREEMRQLMQPARP